MKGKSKGWLAGVAVVAILGGWHLGDVRMGAAACGDTWLTGSYLLLLAAALAGTGLCGRLFWGGTQKAGGWELTKI